MKTTEINNTSSRVFEIALEGGREWKGGGNGNLLGTASIIQCFCHAKGNKHSVNIISQISITRVYIKPEM